MNNAEKEVLKELHISQDRIVDLTTRYYQKVRRTNLPRDLIQALTEAYHNALLTMLENSLR